MPEKTPRETDGRRYVYACRKASTLTVAGGYMATVGAWPLACDREIVTAAASQVKERSQQSLFFPWKVLEALPAIRGLRGDRR